MSMEITAAKIILANLRERIEIGGDGKFRLPGIVTQKELNALEFVISGQLDAPTPVAAQPVIGRDTGQDQSPVPALPTTLEPESVVEPDTAVTLNLSTLSLTESASVLASPALTAFSFVFSATSLTEAVNSSMALACSVAP